MKFKMVVVSVLALGCVGAVVSVRAKLVATRSGKRFYENVTKSNFAIAAFYFRDKNIRRDKALNQQINAYKDAFKVVSRDPFYKNVEMRFILANADRGDLSTIVQSYGFNQSDLPVMILFRGGQQVMDKQGAPAVLRGYVTPDRIKAFIQQNMGTYIQEYAANQAEIDRIYGSTRSSGPDVSFSFGVGYGGYPYYGYYPYYGPRYWWW